MPSEAFYCEQIRSALPEIASPIKPGEMVASWIERASRAAEIASAKITPARLRAYWHRKVECPRIPEYIAVMAAADTAAVRRQVIADLETSIRKREKELRSDHDRLAKSNPVLVFLAPKPPAQSTAREASQGLSPKVRRRAGSRHG